MSDHPRQKRPHYTAKRHLVGFEDTSYICFLKTDEMDTLAWEAHIITKCVTFSISRTKANWNAKHTKMGSGNKKHKLTCEWHSKGIWAGHIEDFISDRYWKVENDTIWQRGVGPGLSAGGWLRGLVRQYKQDRADFRTESFPCHLYLYLYLKRYLYTQLRTIPDICHFFYTGKIFGE